MDLAASNKAALSELKQSTETLVQQKVSGKPVTLKTKLAQQAQKQMDQKMQQFERERAISAEPSPR